VIISDPDLVDRPLSLELQVAWLIGDEVYHKIAQDGGAGIVSGYLVRSTGLIYQVTWGNRQESGHFGFELTSERPL
jgi:hypothetical protein